METLNLINAKTSIILNIGALVWTEGSSQGQRSWSQREAAGPSVPRRNPLGPWRRSGPLDHSIVRWRGRNLAMYGMLRQIRTMNCHLGMKMWSTGLVSIQVHFGGEFNFNFCGIIRPWSAAIKNILKSQNFLKSENILNSSNS